MDLLPHPDERDALLTALAGLIEARGFEPFVCAPLVEPDARFFPDLLEPTARGVRVLALRLLGYAIPEVLDAHVTLCEPGLGEPTHERAVAWFAGIDDGACLFRVDRSQLREDDALVGTLCHEVAHAFRAWANLTDREDPHEEPMTDLTTIYLGFGILATNNAYRFRTSGEQHGVWATSRWSAEHTGYVAPQSMAFALAAQVVARGASEAEVRRIAGLLETNQAASFRAAWSELEADAESLRRRLGVPPRETWPAPWPLVLRPIPDDTRLDPDDDDAPSTPWNGGANVFRVRTPRYANRVGFAGAILGTTAAIAASRLFGTPYDAPAVFGAVGGMVAARIAGRRWTIDTCSEAECGATLGVGSSTCPACGGRIRGVIADRNERLAAEEALRKRERSARPYR